MYSVFLNKNAIFEQDEQENHTVQLYHGYELA